MWLGGTKAKDVGKAFGISGRSVRRIANKFFNSPPSPSPLPNNNCHMVIDGTWFGRTNAFLVFWDTDKQYAQYWVWASGEHKGVVFDAICRLKKAGVILTSLTSDGGFGIRYGTKLLYPNIPTQRCLVHISRKVESLTTKRPKTQAGKDLKSLVKQLKNISSKGQRNLWVGYFKGWCEQYKEFLNEKSHLKRQMPNGEVATKWWYTHKNLRGARLMLKRALPDMFWYLEDKNIPRDSNGLEGRFGSLKQHYRQHRGMNTNSREFYLAWYTKLILNK